MSDTVGVKATFSVDGQITHEFNSSERTTGPPPPKGLGPQGPVEGTDKYAYRYTGTHDHGDLPALKTGGPHEQLVNALLEAKEDSSTTLTALINGEPIKKPDKRSAQGGPDALSGVVQKDASGDGGAPAMAEAMDVCGAAGGTTSGLNEGALPTPPATQPAKRPKP